MITLLLLLPNASSHTPKQRHHSAATGVEVVVADLPAGLVLLDGALKASLGKIDVGANRKVALTLSASKGAELYTLEPVRVTYKPEKDAETQVRVVLCVLRRLSLRNVTPPSAIVTRGPTS